MTHQIRFSVVLYVGLLAIVLAQCATGAGRERNHLSKKSKSQSKGSIHPIRIFVKKGRPVRLLFYREDDSECTAQVVIPDLKIRKDLAVKKETAVELIPEKEGEFTFACGMDMMKGNWSWSRRIEPLGGFLSG